MSEVIERFLNYVKIDTQSDAESEAVPSTAKQRRLAELLVDELEKMGVGNIYYDKDACIVYATIPATGGMEDKDTIGFISHMDTSDEVSGQNVRPKIIRQYDGGDIVLDEDGSVVLSPKDFPNLKQYVGLDLITASGDTLLGADDKAGISEIMTMASHYVRHPEIAHRPIAIAFTPDEEVGRGTENFDLERFGAKYAYTVDGGRLGELECENFNAALVDVHILGRSVHPGSAKGQMKNSILIGQEFQSLLPVFDNPMYTEGYEGFYHLLSVRGTCESTDMQYIIRDHDAEKFKEKKDFVFRAAEFLNTKYGKGTVRLSVCDQYRNMAEIIAKHGYLLDYAKNAMKKANVTPIPQPIRGGTDGALLSFRGLPCPNLSVGGENFHGKYEFACIPHMERMVEVLINLVLEG